MMFCLLASLSLPEVLTNTSSLLSISLRRLTLLRPPMLTSGRRLLVGAPALLALASAVAADSALLDSPGSMGCSRLAAADPMVLVAVAAASAALEPVECSLRRAAPALTAARASAFGPTTDAASLRSDMLSTAPSSACTAAGNGKKKQENSCDCL